MEGEKLRVLPCAHGTVFFLTNELFNPSLDNGEIIMSMLQGTRAIIMSYLDNLSFLSSLYDVFQEIR